MFANTLELEEVVEDLKNKIKELEKENTKFRKELEKNTDELMSWRSKCFDLTEKINQLKQQLKDREMKLHNCSELYKLQRKRLEDSIPKEKINKVTMFD